MIDKPLAADGLFTCPHHPGDLRITPTTCAGMWTRARRSPEDALIRLAPCVGCQIGAAHAGATSIGSAGRSVATPRGSGLACCVRCGRGGQRLVGGLRCISCYNRQRELMAGRNAKGDPPSRHRPLFGAIVGVVDDAGDVQPLRVDLVGSRFEALLTISRATGATRFGRVAGALESTPCPAVPRQKGAFAVHIS